MPSFEDFVRPFQTRQTAPGELYSSQYGLTSQPLITLTPGFGGDASGGLPPITTGSASYSIKVTLYMDQAANEMASEG